MGQPYISLLQVMAGAYCPWMCRQHLTLVLFSGAFYGLSVNPINGNLVLLDAVDFQSNGKLFRYHANTNLIDSVTVGVIPGNALMLF